MDPKENAPTLATPTDSTCRLPTMMKWRHRGLRIEPARATTRPRGSPWPTSSGPDHRHHNIDSEQVNGVPSEVG